MTAPRTFTTPALPCAAHASAWATRPCVRASGMGDGMQRTIGSTVSGKLSKAGRNFINGPGDQTTRMFVAGALSA